jgi:hypothetical protein
MRTRSRLSVILRLSLNTRETTIFIKESTTLKLLLPLFPWKDVNPAMMQSIAMSPEQCYMLRSSPNGPLENTLGPQNYEKPDWSLGIGIYD